MFVYVERHGFGVELGLVFSSNFLKFVKNCLIKRFPH